MAAHRRVTISTTCFELPDPNEDHTAITKEGNLAKALGMLEEAGERGSDLVLLPEVFATKQTGIPGKEAAEPVPGGDISEMLSEAARKHAMYVAGSLYEQRPEGVYNTVALFDRSGDLVGRYHKVHLAPGEEEVALPGTSYPVFETDFGKVGALVCYDLNFPEAARCLMLDGADIILWPTMFSEPRAHYTEFLTRARAIENQVFLVSANYSQKGADSSAVHIGRSAVIDWDGMALADTGRREGVATAVVDLDEPRTVFGLTERLLSDRRPETYGRLQRP